MKATDYHEMSLLLHKADVGDEIEVECRNMRPRRVVVSGKMSDNSQLLVTSGRVRPGHFTGGSLKDYGEGHGVMYQPTMQQQVKYVSSLKIVRRAGNRN